MRKIHRREKEGEQLLISYIEYSRQLFSLIRNFGKQNTRGNVSKISVSLTCY